MLKRYPSLLACYFFLLLSGLSGQSLDELLELTTENNLELKALRQEYLSALERAPQVSQLPDPEVAAGIFVLPAETRLGPQWIRLGATQMFPWKGTLNAKREMALIMARADYQRIAATQLELSFELRKAWLNLYELEETQKIIERKLRLFQLLDRIGLSKVESGQSTLADVLRVRLRIQQLEQEIKILESRSIEPRSTINQILNRPLSTPIVIADSLEVAVIPFEKDTLGSYIQSSHPSINRLSVQQDVARQAQKLNQLDGKPTFGIGLDYIVVGRRDDANPEGNGRDVVMPRASVRVPIYKKKYGAKQREEELKIAALEHQKEDIKSKFLAAIEKAYADYQQARLQVELYEQLSRTSRSVIEILETDYSASGRGFDELLSMQNELISYELESLKAIVRSHLAKAAIERFLIQ